MEGEHFADVLPRIKATAPAADDDAVDDRAAPSGIGVANEQPGNNSRPMDLRPERLPLLRAHVSSSELINALALRFKHANSALVLKS